MAAPSKKFKINDKSTEIVMPNKLKGSKSKLIIKAKRSRPTGFKEWNERETELFIDLMSGNDLNINVKRKVLRGQSKNIGLLNEVINQKYIKGVLERNCY